MKLVELYKLFEIWSGVNLLMINSLTQCKWMKCQPRTRLNLTPFYAFFSYFWNFIFLYLYRILLLFFKNIYLGRSVCNSLWIFHVEFYYIHIKIVKEFLWNCWVCWTRLCELLSKHFEFKSLFLECGKRWCMQYRTKSSHEKSCSLILMRFVEALL